jgi:Tfp pilus assembly protein PilE
MIKKQSGNNEKVFPWISLMIVITIIGVLAWIAILNFFPTPYRSPCMIVENDANAISAAIADYFSDPNHTATPTFDQLKNWKSVTLSGKNTATITGADPNISITITVTDGSGRCSKDYQNASADWDGNGVYTLNIW